MDLRLKTIAFRARIAQKIIDDADRGIVKEGTDPNKYRALKSIGEFLYDNQLTRACIGTDGKNKRRVGFTGAGYKIPMCALGIIFISDFISWVGTPKTERDFILCNTVGTLGLCQFLTPYGFCEKSCEGSSITPILEKVYDDNDNDFKNWVKDNNGTLPGKDNTGRFYTDKDGTKQYVDHDSSKRIFKNSDNTPSSCPGQSSFETELKAGYGSSFDATKPITFDSTNCVGSYDGSNYKWDGSDWVGA